jgi:hypothetical protein
MAESITDDAVSPDLRRALDAFWAAYNARPSKDALQAKNDLEGVGRLSWCRESGESAPTMEFLRLVRRMVP